MSEAIEAAKRIVASVAEADAMLVARALLSSPRVEDVRREALEEAAKVLNMKRSQIRLMAGEMTAQEMRTVQAVLASRICAIRALSPPVG